jgi:conserved hypothetical protein, YceG family
LKKWILRIAVGLPLILGGFSLALYWWLLSYSERPRPGSGTTIAIDIPVGSGPRQTIDLLAKNQVIDDADFFYRWVRYYKRVAGKFKAGELAFRDTMTPEEVLAVLLEGIPITHKITIPEGLRVDEIAQLFQAVGLADATEFEQMARDATFVQQHGLPGDTLEGFLFPETYQFQKHTPLAAILTTMIAQYQKVFTLSLRERAAELGWSELQAITLASIIEKETGVEEEKPIVSAVIRRRLALDMPLQMDPTVIYGVKRFDGTVTRKDLQTAGPYNTYLNRGLPPGPIANPGLGALDAALNPSKTEYLYFVSKNDGSHTFSRTLAEHNRAVEQLRRAVREDEG